MRFRFRFAWLEIAAGFLTLFASVAAAEAEPSPLSRLSSTALLLTACAVFMLHGLRPHRLARRVCFAVAACVSLPAAVWLFMAGQPETAVLQGLLGLWFAAAVLFSEADPGPRASGEVLTNALNLYVAAVFALLALASFRRGTTECLVQGAVLLLIAGGMAWAERQHGRRARLAAAMAAGAACVTLAATFMSVGSFGIGGALLSLFGALLLSVSLDGSLPEAADDLADTTRRQREIWKYERAGETTFWAIAAVSGLYIHYFDPFDVRIHVAALLCAGLATTCGFRLSPAKTLSERRYLAALSGVVAGMLLLITATGGTYGPFIYLAYLSVYAGTAILDASWPLIMTGVYLAYVLAELAFGGIWLGAEGARLSFSQQAAHAAFLSATLLFTGLYTALMARRRAKIEASLLAANRQLAETLRVAVHEREQTKGQAEDLRRLNEDLTEMRSALMNVLEDVEESKRQIENDRRREVASLDALGEGLVATEKDGTIFLCNPTGARLLGLTQKDVIGQPIDRVIRLFAEDGEVLRTEAFETAFEGSPTSIDGKLMLMRDDGRRMPVSGTVAPFLDEDGGLAGIVMAFRDVTVEREIDRQKSDFISIASHQLRTPLSALRWFLDLLLAGDAGTLNPTQTEYLTDMSVSTIRMVKLVGDLLSISRIEAGRLKANPEMIAVDVFVQTLLKEHEPLIKARDIRFTSDISPEAHAFYADPSLTHQAVANLLSNAIKYTPSGGSVSFSARAEPGMTVFTVKDTGVGIPQNQQHRVYDKFFRAENVVAQETVGTGLGLYVTRMIVELSGGRIWFESHEGKGTSFSVALPAQRPVGTMSA